jgi:hypothetical protein
MQLKAATAQRDYYNSQMGIYPGDVIVSTSNGTLNDKMNALDDEEEKEFEF